MVFETRKIQFETLGEYLREIRLGKGFTVESAAAEAGMKPQFLDSLENGNYYKLPPDVYVLGFIRTLAQVYSLDTEVLIQQYRKERDIDRQLHKATGRPNSSKPVAWFRRLVITPRVVTLGLGLLFVFLTVGYVIWQVASINRVPALEIFKPTDRQPIQGTTVEVEGKTDPGTNLSINGQSVFVDSSGKFSVQIGITSGPKELVFEAKNKFDRTVTKTVTVIGEAQPAAQQASLVLELAFSRPLDLSYTTDAGEQQSRHFEANEKAVLQARQSIILSTSDAGATTAILNGKNLGVLGRDGEVLQDVPFSLESGNMK